MTYPKTLAALREQEDRSWAVADALVAEIQTHDGGRVLNGEYDRCSTWLAEQGYDVTPRYLMQMRETARKFVLSERTNSRRWTLPFRLYMVASQSPRWTPQIMDQAEREHWTLRQFSEALTGKRWADDDVEAAKRVLANPERRGEVLDELSSGTRRDVLTELDNRVYPAGRPQSYTPAPLPTSPRLQPVVPPTPYTQDQPDPAVLADQEQSRRLLDDRADIAAIISTYQMIYGRGSQVTDAGRGVLADDLDRAAKWHEAVVQLLTGMPLDRELADFLNGETQ